MRKNADTSPSVSLSKLPMTRSKPAERIPARIHERVHRGRQRRAGIGDGTPLELVVNEQITWQVCDHWVAADSHFVERCHREE